MERKLYNINFASCLHADHIMISDKYDKKTNGLLMSVYIDDEIANKIRNIPIIKHFNESRSMYVPKEYILHEIYKVFPELFEY